jgi:UDP-N-acetylmuramoylalanine--D-glutamate ligase
MSRERIVILGGGESGTGAALLASKKGYEVFLSDAGKINDRYRKSLEASGIDFEEGGHTPQKILNAALVVKSPGISPESATVKALTEKNIPVISEIEFAWRHTHALIIGITGTNGKTTTSALTHHILRKAGLNAGLAGNIGKSFAQSVAENDYDFYVLELSSFQLDDIHSFSPHIAVLLNITPDHLDRYGTMERYIDSKFRITLNQKESDHFIFWSEDPAIAQGLRKHSVKSTMHPFSFNCTSSSAVCIQNGQIIFNHRKQDQQQKQTLMSIFDLALRGKHNLYNSMAASVAAKIIDIKNEVIRESLSDFQSVEHRLERVNIVHGIEFINDSKATNVNSVWYALESMQKPVIWIAGGVDKGNDYSMLFDLVKQKVKAIICLGTDNRKIHKAFKGIVQDITDASSALEAVQIAYAKGRKGDVVLLSPACASFDLFKSYEDRGWQFKEAVRSL